ncbi:MAG: ABC transporter permease, partial [Candidatus Acidiferrales bacterium]
EMLAGRYFSDTENLHREDLAVLGQDAAKALFGTLPALDKDVLVDGSTFRVIGVLERPKGNFGFNDEDRRVLIPYQTFRKIYPASYENAFRIQGRPGELDAAVDDAREVLRRRRKVPYSQPDNFLIQTSQQQVEQFHAIVGMAALAMIVLSSIGLLIGGVGVMNIMLVSVTERTREIGIRKAIGAQRREILLQFLIEAMLISGIGALIGIGLAVAIPFVIETLIRFLPVPGGISIPISWLSVVLAFVVSCATGVLFGYLPAKKAASLQPVESLRYE